jgi:hypothetical protein
VVQLGHPAGYSCDNPWKADQDFVVIDVTGVHNVNVNYCLCDSKIERWQQLMRVCWWPGTVRDPKTCAMFTVVRLFRTLNCLGKVSAHDFLRSLELLSNNDGLNPVFVRVSNCALKLDLTSLPGSSQGIPPHRPAIQDNIDDEARGAWPPPIGHRGNGARRAGTAVSELSPAWEEFARGVG